MRHGFEYISRAIADRVNIYFLAIADRARMPLPRDVFLAIYDRNDVLLPTTMDCITMQPGDH